MPNFIPSREAAMLSFTANIATKVEADPTGFGVALDTATEYKNTQAAFAAAYAVAIDPLTRIKPNITIKNEKKEELLEATRSIVATIQAWPEMTDAKRNELVIPVRDNEPTPIGPPTEMPVLRVAKVAGRVFDLELRNQEDKKLKPQGVRAANIFSFVGDTPPANLKQWTYERGTTRSNPQIVFPDTVAPGTAVWVTALWLSPTDEPGPACAPVKAHINYEGLSQAA